MANEMFNVQKDQTSEKKVKKLQETVTIRELLVNYLEQMA